jgi:hypothetical protein
MFSEFFLPIFETELGILVEPDLIFWILMEPDLLLGNLMEF